MKSFLLTLLVVVSSVVYGQDNALIVTDNGREMLEWDLEFVRNAQESIEISAVLLGGSIAQELLLTIEARLEEVPQLQVHLLSSPILLEKKDEELLKRIAQKYPHNFHYLLTETVAVVWPDVTGTDSHVKMFVIDETYFSTGGTNLDDSQCSVGTFTPPKNYENKQTPIASGLPAGMRDQDIVGKGALAKELRHIFFKLYAVWENYSQTGVFNNNPEAFAQKNRYFPIRTATSVQRFDKAKNQIALASEQTKLILGGPHQTSSHITKEYVRLLQEVKEEIIISNLYFSPCDSIFEALLAAVNRGVKLTILTNGVSDVAPPYTAYFCWANRMNYVPMFYGATFHFWDAWSMDKKAIKNTRIFEYHVQDILLHKKVMVVDGKKCIVGSYNLGTRSDIGDYEMVISIDSAEVVKSIMHVHEKDLKHAREVSIEEACAWYFDPAISYMGELQKRFHGLI